MRSARALDSASNLPGRRAQSFAAAQAFKMPHLIYGLQHAFFEDGPWSAKEEIMPQLARCFSFDMGLLMKLAQIASARGATVPAAARPSA